jgi:2-polyprenyl-3-methyl-5-hydroxy-6-metoxy-1,4-benzoquinol methylase
MMTVAGEAACGICGAGSLEDLTEYSKFRRVTSDCRPWPAGGRIGVCRACGAVQKPADKAFLADIDAIYKSYTIYHQAAGAEQAVFEQSSGLPASRSVKLLDTFRKHANLKPSGRMLDVGCGNGATIRAFGQVAPGWTKAGTEFDAKYRREVEAIPNTEPLHVGPLEAVPGTFDVITMIHVLEHIIEPVAILETLHGKLSPDGLLLIEAPHHPANPFELLIADHRSHFTADSLARTLTIAGYEIVSVSDDWIPKELSVVARAAHRGPGNDESPTDVEGPGAVRAARTRIAESLSWLGKTADQLRRLGADGPVGLFGTSIAGTWLAAEAGDAVAFFVDEDPARAGRTYLGKPVHAPADVPAGSRVFVGLPTAVATGICSRLATSGATYLSPG